MMAKDALNASNSSINNNGANLYGSGVTECDEAAEHQNGRKVKSSLRK